MTEADLDSREITDVCEELHAWAVEFLGAIYGVLVQDYVGRMQGKDASNSL